MNNSLINDSAQYVFLPLIGLWLLSPGIQVSLTLLSDGSDTSRSVGGSGRSERSRGKRRSVFTFPFYNCILKTKIYSKPISPMCKSNCPLNLITACAALCSNNCNQMFAITCHECFTLLWRNFGPLFFAELFNSATLEGFRA